MVDFPISRRDNLKQRPSDSIIQTRCDRRTVATIARYFQGKSLFPRSHAELIRLALEELRIILIHNKLVEDVDSTQEAMTVLDGLGIGGFSPASRATRQLRDALIRDSDVKVPETVQADGVDAALKRMMEDGTVDAIRKRVEGGESNE